MHIRYLLIPLSLVFGFIFFGFFGLALAVIFFIIWFDKALVWFFGSVGIELTTISMIMIGIMHGPLVGFFFALVILPSLEGMKTFYLPAAQAEWPPFFPSPYHLLDGIVATIAWLLSSTPLFLVMIIALLVKYPLTGLIDEFVVGKPPNILRLLFVFVFNMILVVYLKDLFLNIMLL